MVSLSNHVTFVFFGLRDEPFTIKMKQGR